MDDLDFSKPAGAAPAPKPDPAKAARPGAEAMPSPYDPALALRFFRIAGALEDIGAGKRIFAEGDKPGGLFSRGARIYLVLEGQVALTLNGKPLHLVLPGEIFGEMALISDAPRSATATALKASRLIALEEKHFLRCLAQAPEFALMLVGMLAQQLRRGFERVLATRPGPLPPREGGQGLDKPRLAELKLALGDRAPTPMQAGNALVTAGAIGVCMYVVVSGRVSIAIDGRGIEDIGAGEIFGETALLGPAQRAATATATADGGWLAVSRNEFLDIVRERPALGIALLRSMSQRLQHVGALLGG